MALSTLFGLKKPATTDPATVAADISANAQLTETISKNGIALQTNTSTTAYTSDFPLRAYTSGHSFIFIPLYTCTGTVTINFNGLGSKKIFLENGTTQVSYGSQFQKGIQYLLIYDSAIDGGIGAFKSIRLSPEIPIGQVNYYAMATAPSGWLECNGTAVSRTTYADLFRAIGTTFGTGNGSTTFNLPDLRGEFIRGYDHGRGIDTGRVFGSAQNGTVFGNSVYADYISDGEADGTSTANTFGSSGSGTVDRYRVRPRNIALLPCIKY